MTHNCNNGVVYFIKYNKYVLTSKICIYNLFNNNYLFQKLKLYIVVVYTNFQKLKYYDNFKKTSHISTFSYIY